MAATVTARKTSWIVCDDFAAGPYRADRAAKLLDGFAGECANAHRIVVSATKPLTITDLREMRAEWDEPFDADPGDELAHEERKAQTRALAEATLNAPLGTRLGGVTIVSGGWSKQTADAADAVAAPGRREWLAALGLREYAVLTGDGRGARRDAFCKCPEDADAWVRYEAWTGAGMVAHGFVCPSCRRITQTG